MTTLTRPQNLVTLIELDEAALLYEINRLCVFAAFRRPHLGDAVYRAVTEGRQDLARDRGYPYSSCGDLAHWLLYRLGVRDRDVINRDECGGWRVGENISRLAGHPRFEWDAPPVPGSIVIHDDPEHVVVLLDDVRAAQYGQPGGDVRPLARKRPVIGRLRIRAALEHAHGRKLLTTATDQQIPRTLRPGCVGDDVAWLRMRLRVAHGSHYDGVTGDAVRAHQRASGLDDDGIVGRNTWASLAETPWGAR